MPKSDALEFRPRPKPEEIGCHNELAIKGYCVVQDVISPENLNALKKILSAHFRNNGRCRFGGKYDVRGLNLSDDIARIICVDPVLQVMKACVDPDTPVMTGECDLTMNTTASWHKDTTDGMNLGPTLYEDAKFAVYKIGIYLQDQSAKAREVFKVKPGSHLRRDADGLPRIPVPVKAGDLVIFDLRLDHAGQLPSLFEKVSRRVIERAAKLMKFDPDQVFTSLRSGVNTALFRRNERYGVFVTFGPKREAVYAYEQASRSYHGPILGSLAPDIMSKLSLHQIEIIQTLI